MSLKFDSGSLNEVCEKYFQCQESDSGGCNQQQGKAVVETNTSFNAKNPILAVATKGLLAQVRKERVTFNAKNPILAVATEALSIVAKEIDNPFNAKNPILAVATANCSAFCYWLLWSMFL